MYLLPIFYHPLVQPITCIKTNWANLSLWKIWYGWRMIKSNFTRIVSLKPLQSLDHQASINPQIIQSTTQALTPRAWTNKLWSTRTAQATWARIINAASLITWLLQILNRKVLTKGNSKRIWFSSTIITLIWSKDNLGLLGRCLWIWPKVFS